MDSNNNFFLHTTYLLIGLCLFICSKTANSADATSTSAASDKVLAEVNGRKITTNTVAKYQKMRGMPRDSNTGQQQKMMLEELINLELIYADAVKNGVDKQPSVVDELERIRVNVIASAMLKQTSDSVKVTDDELKKAYAEHTKNMGGTEYKASHILLETEDEAKQIIEQLNQGTDFATLAKQKSTGPSGANGGDLGWFNPEQMVKPFTIAVEALQDGQYSKVPVKTQFGWHVVLREQSRKLDPPPFDSLKPQLRMRLTNKGVETYIQSLRNQAQIKRF
ncbi:peptidylprolyl isomerase [Kaarinaea lacus]